MAVIAPLSIIMLIGIFGLARWVLSFQGLFILSLLVVIQHLLFVKMLCTHTKQKPYLSQGIVCALFVGTMATGIFANKDTLLGFNFYRVANHSMEPALYPGDLIVVDTWVLKDTLPKLNDIVLFRRPDSRTVYIKRVVGVPANQLEVGPERVTEHVSDNHIDSRSRIISVDPGHYYLVGDNYSRSWDSRHFGGVPPSAMIGLAVDVLSRDINFK